LQNGLTAPPSLVHALFFELKMQVSCVYLCEESSATCCCVGKRAASRLREVIVPPLFGGKEAAS